MFPSTANPAEREPCDDRQAGALSAMFSPGADEEAQ